MIEKNKMVTLSYTLSDGKSKEVIEQTTDEKPLKFVYGLENMLPKFESEINGLKEGDDFEMYLKADEAYGNIDEKFVVDLDKNMFLMDGVFNEDIIKVDNLVPMQTKNGEMINGLVKEITDNMVKMDFNHPLAGIDLSFTGKILEVRDATDEEKSQSETPNV